MKWRIGLENPENPDDWGGPTTLFSGECSPPHFRLTGALLEVHGIPGYSAGYVMKAVEGRRVTLFVDDVPVERWAFKAEWYNDSIIPAIQECMVDPAVMYALKSADFSAGVRVTLDGELVRLNKPESFYPIHLIGATGVITEIYDDGLLRASFESGDFWCHRNHLKSAAEVQRIASTGYLEGILEATRKRDLTNAVQLLLDNKVVSQDLGVYFFECIKVITATPECQILSVDESEHFLELWRKIGGPVAHSGVDSRCAQTDDAYHTQPEPDASYRARILPRCPSHVTKQALGKATGAELDAIGKGIYGIVRGRVKS